MHQCGDGAMGSEERGEGGGDCRGRREIARPERMFRGIGTEGAGVFEAAVIASVEDEGASG